MAAAKSKRSAPRGGTAGGSATSPATNPAVLLVHPAEAGAKLARTLNRRGWPTTHVPEPNDASAALAESNFAIAIVRDDIAHDNAGVRATLNLLRRMAAAAPVMRRIVLTGRSDAHTLLAYVNQGRAHRVLAAATPARVTEALESAWSDLERERTERIAGVEARGAKADLHRRTDERAQELSRTNTRLRRALREIARKNEALTTLNESLRVQSTTDSLTGLFNRREFLNRIRTEWGRYRRYGRPLSMIMLDIDHFKRINDTYGHECGDVVLRELGRLILENKRAQDLCCRYGGEEFVVLVTETTLDAAFHVAEGLRELIAEHAFVYGGQPIEVRVSLGVAGAAEQQPPDVEAFINLADQAMYAAKHAGRNRTMMLPATPRTRRGRPKANRPAASGRRGTRAKRPRGKT